MILNIYNAIFLKVLAVEVSFYNFFTEEAYMMFFLFLLGIGKSRGEFCRMFPKCNLAVTGWVWRSMRKLFLLLSLLLSHAAHVEGKKDNQFIWKPGRHVLDVPLSHFH